MLDNTTKQKIDTLRDILVGKVSDPKSQVEQITIALFYKFMWDMDNVVVELGGKPTHFSDDYSQYSWDKLFDPSLGGEEVLSLYKEAVEKMENNPHIPDAVRDIFRRAYLPYNDPSTLRMFLKVVHEGFHYSHSEMLGDAFEYLLSILGTQGNAGQFRTPRHIIDFVIDCVNPQKGDVICDPSCGTAGFVISAYKHILKQNTEKKVGDKLSPSDRKKLANNLIGLDIDPMMVKLALANMYLHGFHAPDIYEYDSLTNEERWNDIYDVVLANPPFMTPKGGIKPHKRFNIKSSKAEVLFVDLISTHLSKDGRAGIIVPDGIICNSPNQYVKLRKMLFDGEYIYSVISLPKGVFLPYADVKTSILLIDKKIAKKTKNILFINIKNDGYELGSRRQKIKKNDLPEALVIINNFKKSIFSGKENELKSNKNSFIINKKEILRSPSVSLNGKRYMKDIILKSQYDIVFLNDDLIEETKNKIGSEDCSVWSVSNKLGFIKSEDFFKGNVASEDISNYKKIFPNDFAYNPARFNVGSIALNNTENTGCVSPMYVTFRIKDISKLHPLYLLLILKSKIGLKQIRKFSDGSVRQTLSFANLKFIQFPLPPYDKQITLVIEKINEINKLNQLIDIERAEIANNLDDVFGLDLENWNSWNE